MNRRTFINLGIGVGTSAALDGWNHGARAEHGCAPTQFGMMCASYISINKLRKTYATQHMSEWCWAASISMLLGYYGHPVRQERIVTEAYGGIADMPGAYPQLIGSLNRQWTDDHGDDFTVEVNGIYAPEMGQTDFSNQDIADALDGDDPLLYCTAQHAMVLTAIKYIGPQVVEGWVMDPWPGNGLRKLAPAEMVPMPMGRLRMAATISVEDA